MARAGGTARKMGQVPVWRTGGCFWEPPGGLKREDLCDSRSMQHGGGMEVAQRNSVHLLLRVANGVESAVEKRRHF